MFNWLFRRKENAIEKDMKLSIQLMMESKRKDEFITIFHLALTMACDDLFKYTGKEGLNPDFYTQKVKERFGYM